MKPAFFFYSPRISVLALTAMAMLWPNVFQAATVFPPVEQLPAKSELPDPLVMMNGQRVTTKEQWFNERRPELKALFQHYMYGYIPEAPTGTKYTILRTDSQALGGKASLKEVHIPLGTNNAPGMHLLLVVPNQRSKPAPVFVGLNFCGNHTLLADPQVALPRGWMPNNCPGCTNNVATVAGRGKEVNTWALEQSIDRGYAVATFYYGDIDPDKNDFTDGIHPHYFKPGQTARGPQDWGSIAAWALGLFAGH